MDSSAVPGQQPAQEENRAATAQPTEEGRYRAFISYSHAADGKLAPALQRGLHRLAKPWYRMPAFRVFRDTTSLSATPALWSSIEEALATSEFFILLASPEAAASEWVNQEVTWWLEHKPRQNLLIALTDGDLTWDHSTGDFDPVASTALPPALRGAFREEPLWVDARSIRDDEHVSLRHPAFREVVADLAAPLHGVGKEDLIGEDIRQQRRTTRWRNSAIAALVVLSLATGLSSVQFLAQRNEAREQRDLAISRLLAAQSDRIVDTRPEAAVLVGLQSLSVGRGQQPQPPAGLVTGLANLHHVSERYRTPGSFSVSFSPRAGLLAMGDQDAAVRLWDVGSRRPYREPLRGHTAPVQAVAFSPDGELLASTGDTTVRLWDVGTARPHGEPLVGPTGGGNSVAFSPDGTLLAWGGAEETVRLWDVATGQPRGEPLIGHTDSVTAVAFSPDGRLLASRSPDMTVRLWDVATGQPRGEPLTGHTDVVNAVAFSPDGELLASASADGTLRLWDVATGQPQGEPFTHPDVVNAVAFSPDGEVLGLPPVRLTPCL